MPAVDVKDLSKTFRLRLKSEGKHKRFLRRETSYVNAVNDINFTVESGELLAFIGPNGAGKSTTIKLLTGILYPDSGRIRVLGIDPHKQRKALAYRIGTVFGQKSQLWFHLPPGDSFRLLSDIYDLDRKQSAKRIDFLSEVFAIQDFINTPVRKLSLGQRIRCEIAASLIHEPSILFLDEPTIGLDVVVKQRIRDLIKTINAESDVTVFLTSHDTGDIEKLCKRAIVINSGAIVWDGTIKELKYTYLTKRVISLKLEEPYSIEIPGVTLVKRKDYAAKVEVDLEVISLEHVIDSLMKRHRIVDMTISNPPLEEVIAHMYKEGP